MKKLLLCLLLISFIFVSAEAGDNLINNSGFEESNSEGLASNFFTDAYQDPQFTTVFKLSDIAHTGKNSAYIRNAAPNDARFVQTLAVEPDTLYRLSGYIMANVDEEGKGANLSIEGVYSFTEPLFDTQGEWQYVELYGKTGSNQKSLSIYVRLGGYSGESTGEAYFDDISLERVEGSVEIYDNWFSISANNNNDDEQSEEDTLHRPAIYISIIAYILLAYIAIRYMQRYNIKNDTLLLIVGLVVAFVLRVILAYRIYGHGIDMVCFTAWANALHQYGIKGFYSNINFCDYPPGYMYVLRLHGYIFGNIQPSENLIWLITKFPSIIADILSALLLYMIAKKRAKGASILALLYAFNPLVVLTGAVWGQIDSVFTLLILLACYLLLINRVDFAIPVYTLSCLVKPQGLMFGPIALAYLFKLPKNKDLLKKFLIGLLLCAVIFAAVVIPFTPEGRGLDWISEKYSETLSSYEYATVNTANIYYIMAANWVKQDNNINIIFAIVYGIALVLLSLYMLIRHRALFNDFANNIQSKPLIAIIVLSLYSLSFISVYIFNPSYIAFSMLNLIYIILFAILLIFLLPKERIAYILALSLLGMYCMTVRMHERYVFAAVALFLLDYAYSKNIKSLIMGILTGLAVYVNVAIVLDNAMVLGTQQGHLNNDTIALASFLSVYNCLVMALGIYFALSKDIEIKILGQSDKYRERSIVESALKPKKTALISKKDWLIMLIIMIVYSIAGFYRLGSFSNPQSMFVSSSDEEQIVFELEESSRFNLLYYGGINYNSFSVSTSDDGQNFGESFPAELDQSQIFRWKYLCTSSLDSDDNLSFSHTPIILSGKYIKLTFDEGGVNLGEIIVRKPSDNGIAGELINIKPISHEGQDEDFSTTPALYLYDEQSSLEGEPSYYNSTYFDEIYHARTGYEFVHGIRPYETSHPPLGKLFMSLGILIFGMTPFGYRLFGVVAGVLMLPAIYISAKYLFNSTKLAATSAILLALDLMHLAQTRIATIDSYPVLFILLSFMFMLKYISLDHFAMELNKTYRPLLLSGICFGLSVASKWIGMYAGVGLAIMYFTSQAIQIRAGKLAKHRLSELSSEREIEAAESYTYRFILTSAHCVFYFIIIPCIIYFLCYIPYFAPTGGITIKKLIDAQIGMFDYHSSPGLGMDHPYYSPWWQWPFILKPMWYYLGYYEPQGIDETIYCMGNPAIFYWGAIAMIVTIVIFIWKLINGNYKNIAISFAISIGFLSQYLPWILVPRGTYIYHYFASVPFIILSAMYIFHIAYQRFKKHKFIDIVLMLFMLIALAMFVGFYPYATGIPASNAWLDAMKWFKGIGY